MCPGVGIGAKEDAQWYHSNCGPMGTQGLLSLPGRDCAGDSGSPGGLQPLLWVSLVCEKSFVLLLTTLPFFALHNHHRLARFGSSWMPTVQQ